MSREGSRRQRIAVTPNAFHPKAQGRPSSPRAHPGNVVDILSITPKELHIRSHDRSSHSVHSSEPSSTRPSRQGGGSEMVERKLVRTRTVSTTTTRAAVYSWTAGGSARSR